MVKLMRTSVEIRYPCKKFVLERYIVEDLL